MNSRHSDERKQLKSFGKRRRTFQDEEELFQLPLRSNGHDVGSEEVDNRKSVSIVKKSENQNAETSDNFERPFAVVNNGRHDRRGSESLGNRKRKLPEAEMDTQNKKVKREPSKHAYTPSRHTRGVTPFSCEKSRDGFDTAKKLIERSKKQLRQRRSGEFSSRCKIEEKYRSSTESKYSSPSRESEIRRSQKESTYSRGSPSSRSSKRRRDPSASPERVSRYSDCRSNSHEKDLSSKRNSRSPKEKRYREKEKNPIRSSRSKSHSASPVKKAFVGKKKETYSPSYRNKGKERTDSPLRKQDARSDKKSPRKKNVSDVKTENRSSDTREKLREKTDSLEKKATKSEEKSPIKTEIIKREASPISLRKDKKKEHKSPVKKDVIKREKDIHSFDTKSQTTENAKSPTRKGIKGNHTVSDNSSRQKEIQRSLLSQETVFTGNVSSAKRDSGVVKDKKLKSVVSVTSDIEKVVDTGKCDLRQKINLRRTSTDQSSSLKQGLQEKVAEEKARKRVVISPIIFNSEESTKEKSSNKVLTLPLHVKGKVSSDLSVVCENKEKNTDSKVEHKCNEKVEHKENDNSKEEGSDNCNRNEVLKTEQKCEETENLGHKEVVKLNKEEQFLIKLKEESDAKDGVMSKANATVTSASDTDIAIENEDALLDAPIASQKKNEDFTFTLPPKGNSDMKTKSPAKPFLFDTDSVELRIHVSDYEIMEFNSTFDSPQKLSSDRKGKSKKQTKDNSMKTTTCKEDKTPKKLDYSRSEKNDRKSRGSSKLDSGVKTSSYSKTSVTEGDKKAKATDSVSSKSIIPDTVLVSAKGTQMVMKSEKITQQQCKQLKEDLQSDWEFLNLIKKKHKLESTASREAPSKSGVDKSNSKEALQEEKNQECLKIDFKKNDDADKNLSKTVPNISVFEKFQTAKEDIGISEDISKGLIISSENVETGSESEKMENELATNKMVIGVLKSMTKRSTTSVESVQMALAEQSDGSGKHLCLPTSSSDLPPDREFICSGAKERLQIICEEDGRGATASCAMSNVQRDLDSEKVSVDSTDEQLKIVCKDSKEQPSCVSVNDEYSKYLTLNEEPIVSSAASSQRASVELNFDRLQELVFEPNVNKVVQMVCSEQDQFEGKFKAPSAYTPTFGPLIAYAQIKHIQQSFSPHSSSNCSSPGKLVINEDAPDSAYSDIHEQDDSAKEHVNLKTIELNGSTRQSECSDQDLGKEHGDATTIEQNENNKECNSHANNEQAGKAEDHEQVENAKELAEMEQIEDVKELTEMEKMENAKEQAQMVQIENAEELAKMVQIENARDPAEMVQIENTKELAEMEKIGDVKEQCDSVTEVDDSDKSETEVDNKDKSVAEVDKSDKSEIEVDNSDKSETEVDNSGKSETEVDNSDKSETEVDNSDKSEGGEQDQHENSSGIASANELDDSTDHIKEHENYDVQHEHENQKSTADHGHEVEEELEYMKCSGQNSLENKNNYSENDSSSLKDNSEMEVSDTFVEVREKEKTDVVTCEVKTKDEGSPVRHFKQISIDSIRNSIKSRLQEIDKKATEMEVDLPDKNTVSACSSASVEPVSTPGSISTTSIDSVVTHNTHLLSAVSVTKCDSEGFVTGSDGFIVQDLELSDSDSEADREVQDINEKSMECTTSFKVYEHTSVKMLEFAELSQSKSGTDASSPVLQDHTSRETQSDNDNEDQIMGSCEVTSETESITEFYDEESRLDLEDILSLRETDGFRIRRQSYEKSDVLVEEIEEGENYQRRRNSSSEEGELLDEEDQDAKDTKLVKRCSELSSEGELSSTTATESDHGSKAEKEKALKTRSTPSHSSKKVRKEQISRDLEKSASKKCEKHRPSSCDGDKKRSRSRSRPRESDTRSRTKPDRMSKEEEKDRHRHSSYEKRTPKSRNERYRSDPRLKERDDCRSPRSIGDAKYRRTDLRSSPRRDERSHSYSSYPKSESGKKLRETSRKDGSDSHYKSKYSRSLSEKISNSDSRGSSESRRKLSERTRTSSRHTSFEGSASASGASSYTRRTSVLDDLYESRDSNTFGGKSRDHVPSKDSGRRNDSGRKDSSKENKSSVRTRSKTLG